jgi:fructokinase
MDKNIHPLLGGIEAGGTKFVCAIGYGPSAILAKKRFPTTTPSETLQNALDFFLEQSKVFGPLTALGIAAFGPLDPDSNSVTWGSITTTPKPGWANTDVAGYFKEGLSVPIGFDTDVNGAALAEWTWGAGQNCEVVLYLTIGTGIGGGVVIHGQPLHGLVHPEMGHMRLAHDFQRDPFEGICPYHQDCFEGLACGPALEKRWRERAETLKPDHPAWRLEAHYIALACANLACILSPHKIILGGGVMAQQQLFPLIRDEVKHLLNNYIHASDIIENIGAYIIPPSLGNEAGVLGAFVLALQAL